MPADVNCRLNVEPAEMFPLLNRPSLLVTVCAVLSLFVHVIVVPAATVMLEGLKVLFCIQTSLAPGPVGAGVEGAGSEESFSQDVRLNRSKKKIVRMMLFACIINVLILAKEFVPVKNRQLIMINK